MCDSVSIISGVPRGIFGPPCSVLFIVFINDICRCMATNVTLKLFADGAQLYSTVHTDINFYER